MLVNEQSKKKNNYAKYSFGNFVKKKCSKEKKNKKKQKPIINNTYTCAYTRLKENASES